MNQLGPVDDLTTRLTRSEQRFRALVDEAVDGVIVLDPEGLAIYANPAACALLDRPLDDVRGYPIGVPVSEGDTTTVDIRRPNGSTVVEIRAVESRWDDGPATILWLRDLTSETNLRRSLQAALDRYDLVASGTQDGVFDWDLETDEIYYSARWNALVGLDPTAHIGQKAHWFDRVHTDDLERLADAIATHLAGAKGRVECEFRIFDGSGYRWMHVRGISGKVDGRLRLAGSMSDVTQRHESEDVLRMGALYDNLTGVANRALLATELERRHADLQRSPDAAFAVAYLDITDFKAVNDDFGHEYGDRLLRFVANRVLEAVRPTDLVARVGGDEFVAVYRASSPEAARAIAERIRDRTSVAADVGLREPLAVRASVGFRYCDDPALAPDDVLKEADAAMYRSKRAGSVDVTDFDSEPTGGQIGKARLKALLAAGELEVRYLPVMSIERNAVVGVEAILRWNHPEQGPLAAAEVLDVTAPQAFPDLDGWVLGVATDDAATWSEAGLHLPAGLTVNVARADLRNDGYIDRVIRVVGGSRCIPLGFDLDEGDIATLDAPIDTTLDLVRAEGVAIHLDNFGTGNTSVALLFNMRPSIVKIDTSVVAEIDRGRQVDPLVQAIVAAARAIGAKVLAEGVERPSQLDRMRDLGCDQWQGALSGGLLAAADVPAAAAVQ